MTMPVTKPVTEACLSGATSHPHPLTEINQLTEELEEAIAVATFESLEATIDAWHEAELLAGRAVPDFWDDCRTSEMLAQHLTALGWVREPGALAAIQAHHDLKHGRAGGRSAAVLSPPDRALYEATGIKHAVLGFDEGSLDDVRRAPAREVSDVGFVEQMLAFEAVMAADSETLRALEDGDV